MWLITINHLTTLVCISAVGFSFWMTNVEGCMEVWFCYWIIGNCDIFLKLWVYISQCSLFFHRIVRYKLRIASYKVRIAGFEVAIVGYKVKIATLTILRNKIRNVRYKVAIASYKIRVVKYQFTIVSYKLYNCNLISNSSNFFPLTFFFRIAIFQLANAKNKVRILKNKCTVLTLFFHDWLFSYSLHLL